LNPIARLRYAREKPSATFPFLREEKMAKTKSFRELVQSRVKLDSKFVEALLREGVDATLSGDVKTGKVILRYCVNNRKDN